MEYKDFIKLTKKQKLEIPQESYNFEIDNVSKLVMIPTGKKRDYYSLCAFFVESKGKWYRLPDYDCFRFKNSPMTLKGDFENDGIQFFLANNGENWKVEYGGEFINLTKE